MDLVIVESPTKARALRGFLGRGYQVLASMGHIRDLPPKQLAVDVDRGFRPTYHLNRGARDHSEGEYYHTWALKRLIEEGKVVFKRITGRRFDLGEPEGYLRAIMQSARDDPDLLEAMREESQDLFKKG